MSSSESMHGRCLIAKAGAPSRMTDGSYAEDVTTRRGRS
ncbi:hypothetical protein LC55x_5723 [Lysobacter capsici]|uniref:Uncharacterized protein n=1 Tax=Lysobacter capsici AZ78 TaxID=1444315 RepID=A0A108UAB6_9GAMM|nr:hypothetical protein LC55x_5723 [Lysobacter capsici]KWS05460.1 hypothetical protein AZ78_3012 [Lysobacter capsici AZ78]